MIKLKTNEYGLTTFYGSREVYLYFDEYMVKDAFNDVFCHCGSGEDSWGAWHQLPTKDDFTKRDWKIVVEGFRHFGVELEETL